MSVPFATAYTVTRNKGSYVDGVWVDADDFPIEVEITAHIQAMSESDADQQMLNRLGVESVEGCVWINSDDELYTARKGDGYQPDVLTFNGQDYEIRSAASFPDVLPHWECIGVLIDDNV